MFDLLKFEKGCALRPRIIQFIHMIIKGPIAITEKRKYWVNVVKHFCIDYSCYMSKAYLGYKWIVKDKNIIKKLSCFILDTEDLCKNIALVLST